MNKLDGWIARRFLFTKKEIGFISWSGLISIIGIAIGSFSLIIAVSVLNGFEDEIQEKVIGYEGDVKIYHVSISQEIEQEIVSLLNHMEEVEGYVSYIERKGIILSDSQKDLVWVKAIKEFKQTEVYSLNYVHLYNGESGIPTIILGVALADNLGVTVGDTIRLMSPLDSQILVGFPTSAPLMVKGIFQTNILDYDEKKSFIPLSIGKDLFRMNKNIHGIDVRLKKGTNPKIFREKLRSQIPRNIHISTWADLHKTLFSAMRMEKIGSMVVLSLIILVASFNLTSTLVMLVIEKIGEIGILKTIGATRKRIKMIFGIQGGIIGSVGLGIGLLTGLAVVLIQKHWAIIKLPERIYFLKALPMQLPVSDVLLIFLIGIILIAVALIYPAKIASRLLPKDSIHFEK